MTRHDRHELRSAILKALAEGNNTTKTITETLPMKVSSATVRKHLLAMAAEGYVREGWQGWDLPFRGKEHVGTVYHSPERKLFDAAADLVQSVLDRTSIDQRTQATAEEVRDGFKRLVWMEDQNRHHGLTMDMRPIVAINVPLGTTVPRYLIADKGEEALFKIGKP